jgi:hypothetical protein
MSTPALKARAERETLQVLNPFLEVLRSPADIKIPRETLVGALGHFLSSLEGDRLDSFIQDILASPSLWKTLDSAEIQAAVRPAPAAKVAALRPEVKDGWILRNQLPKACEAWLKEVVKAVTRSGLTTNCLVVLIGLLQGIDDVPDIDWGKARVDLEEEIVIALGERFEKNNCDALDLFSSVAEHIDDNRLRALDLRVRILTVLSLTYQQVIPRLNVELFTAIGFPPPPAPAAFPVKTLDMDQLSLVSRGLARSFLAMSEGSSQSQQYAWEELEAFVRRMFDCAAKLQDEFGDYEPRKGGAGEFLQCGPPLTIRMGAPKGCTSRVHHRRMAWCRYHA